MALYTVTGSTQAQTGNDPRTVYDLNSYQVAGLRAQGFRVVAAVVPGSDPVATAISALNSKVDANAVSEAAAIAAVGAGAPVGAHRYWKFASMIPFTPQADAVTLNEIAAFDPSSAALTIAAARCNLYYTAAGPYPASNVFNGNKTDYWVGLRGCDLTLDFGTPVQFASMVITTPAANNQTPVGAFFTFSDDGIKFKVAGYLDLAVAMGLADDVVPLASHDYTIALPTTL
jgi:hypothetical protein